MIHIRDIKRLKQIVTVFFEEGFGYYLAQAKLHHHLPFVKRVQQIIPSAPINEQEMQAVALRRAFERLGPTFVKLGQLLSLRPDLVPPEYCKEFEKLQDKVPSFSYADVQRIIEEDMRKPLGKLFRSFDKKPIAAASIAQVHKAILPSGQIVAVKVQRPMIRETIDADLDILFHIAHSLEKHLPELRNYRPVEIVKEFALWTRREINFTIEARNALLLREELKDNKGVLVPKVIDSHSSSRVLMMEFVEGERIDNLKALKRYHINTKKLTYLYFTSLLEQALIHGFFHADPHPANIFVNKQGKLIYLDYGIMGTLSSDDRSKVVKFILSVPEKNPDKSLDIIISLAKDTSKADIEGFKEEALTVLRDTYSHSIGEKSFGKAMYEVISLGAKHGVIYDANHVLIAKAIYQAEGLALKLCPQFKVAEGLELFSQRYLQARYSPAAIAKQLRKLVESQRELVLDLPEHISKILHHLEHPEPKHELNVSQLEELEKEMEHVSKIKSTGIVVTALILGSALLFYLEGRTTILGIPISVGLFTLAIALLLSLFLIKHKRGAYDERSS